MYNSKHDLNFKWELVSRGLQVKRNKQQKVWIIVKKIICFCILTVFHKNEIENRLKTCQFKNLKQQKDKTRRQSFVTQKQKGKTSREGYHAPSRLFVHVFPLLSSSKLSLKKLVIPSWHPFTRSPPSLIIGNGVERLSSYCLTIDTTMELCSCIRMKGSKTRKASNSPPP